MESRKANVHSARFDDPVLILDRLLDLHSTAIEVNVQFDDSAPLRSEDKRRYILRQSQSCVQSGEVSGRGFEQMRQHLRVHLCRMRSCFLVCQRERFGCCQCRHDAFLGNINLVVFLIFTLMIDVTGSVISATLDEQQSG